MMIPRSRILPLILALLCSSAWASSSSEPRRDLRELFETFVIEHGKEFVNEAEKELRFQNFAQTDAYLQDFSTQSNRSFTIKHTAFSDLHATDIAQRMAAFWSHPVGERLTEDEERAYFRLGATSEILPKSVDWSTTRNPMGKPIITPPQNQGHCGACWAFVAASVVESAVAISHGLLTPLSAQELLDCDVDWNAGCMGGNPIQAFDFIQRRGLTTAQSYPYRGQQLACQKDTVPVSSIESYRILRAYDESILMAAVARQPVAVGVAGQHPSFLFYGGGIYDDKDCGTELNHALVIVGYGTDLETGMDFWLAKNSWGVGWGEAGYVRIARKTATVVGAGTGPGICGLATAPSIPLGAVGGSATALAAAREKQSVPSMDNSALIDNGGNSDGNRTKKRTFHIMDLDVRTLPSILGIIIMIFLVAYFFAPSSSSSSSATAGSSAGVVGTGGMGIYVQPPGQPATAMQYYQAAAPSSSAGQESGHVIYQPVVTRPPSSTASAILQESSGGGEYPIACYAPSPENATREGGGYGATTHR